MEFHRGSPTGEGVTSLSVDTGSRRLAMGGSPVLIRLPSGRLVYNAAGSGNVWVNESGRSDGVWKEYQTTSRADYSRNLQYVDGTGRVVILNNQDTSTLGYAEVDLGRSDGPYYQLVNRRTDQVIGTGGRTNDANIGNGAVPDVRLEAPGSVSNTDTQYWHVVTEPKGGVTLLNKSAAARRPSGRATRRSASGSASGSTTAPPAAGTSSGPTTGSTSCRRSRTRTCT
ncbi:hypothetical protein GCM10017771_18980 [Streptomyces capitiformicae]|uniref:Ricin B lectin domain-containing protein n=1 Tax=Streptomyces capitiformicae TaxID=2014920 RepID=A0A919GJF8_9ACTN|nr:hypothetical protein GCM10017771_18980 [Streptomyces capitiformicae]